MSEEQSYLSVAIAGWKAADFINATIEAIEAFEKKQGYGVEIVIVCMQAGDNTYELVQEKMKTNSNVKAIVLPDRVGKGKAIQLAMAEATGRYRCFIDADMGVSIDQVEGALALIDKYDVVIGSRYMKGGEHSRRSLARTIVSRGGNMMFWLVLGLHYTDTRAPMKLYRAEVAKMLFPKLQLPGFGFDTELLFLARKFGYSVAEYPVHWEATEESTVDIKDDAIRSILELFQVRWYWLRGYYKR